MIDLRKHQARIETAQLRVADALDGIEDEGTRDRARAAVRELSAAWRSLLSEYAGDAARLLDRVT